MACPTTVAVLVYHSISTVTTRTFAAFTVERALFEEHLAALREQAFDVIPFREVPSALALGRRAVAISIDDGLADAGSDAAPALLHHGLSATLFVPSGYVGGSARWLRGEDRWRAMLSWSDITDLSRSGFEIGSHGRAHLAADANRPEVVRDDAATSKMELEDHIGQTVGSFAYPYGYDNASARRAIRAAGFSQACTVGDFPARASDDRWALPRLDVRAGTTPEGLLAMINRQPSFASRGWSHAKRASSSASRRLRGWRPAVTRMEAALR